MINSTAFITGSQYTSAFKGTLEKFKGKLMEFYQTYQQTKPVIENLEKPRTAQELLEIAQSPETQAVMQAYDSMKNKIEDMAPYLQSIETNFASESYKIKQIEDKGWLQKGIDYARVFHGGQGLISDDFDNVRLAIPAYIKSISEQLNIFRIAKSYEQNAKSKLMQAAATNKQIEQQPQPQQPKTQEEKPPWQQDIDDLERNLGGKLGL